MKKWIWIECLFHVWVILHKLSLCEDQLQQLQRQDCDSEDISLLFFKGAHCLSFREEDQTQSFEYLQYKWGNVTNSWICIICYVNKLFVSEDNEVPELWVRKEYKLCCPLVCLFSHEDKEIIILQSAPWKW